MLHIITEDSGSGYTFWNAVNKRILNSKANMIKGDGIGTINKICMDSIRNKTIKSGDTIFIALDNTGTLQASKEIDRVTKSISDMELRLHITSYRSFEEIFLSFIYLEEWLRLSNNKLIDFIQYIRNCIMNNIDFMHSHEGYEEIFEQIKIRCKKIKHTDSVNRESFSSGMLRQITHGNIGFYVSKDTIGACWIKNCCELKEQILSNPGTSVKQFIKKCGLTDELTAEQKLLCLEANSVLNTGGIRLNKLKEEIE